MSAALKSGRLTKGPHLQAYERELATHLEVQHAIAVSSCTSGLMLVYQTLTKGEVIVPSFTFAATVSALVWAGLRPVYVDVDRTTMNIDPAACERAVSPATTAVVAVHNFGNPAAVADLGQIADRHRLSLVFDAAHGFGSCYEGAPVGSQGRAHVFSSSPTKLLVTGEGGVVATDDDALAHHIRIGREYGFSDARDSAFAGLNARLPELSAILGRHGLRVLEAAATRRNEVAELYRSQLTVLPGIGFQEVAPGARSSFKDFAITVDSSSAGFTRDILARALVAERVETRAYYSPPVHQQSAYRQQTPTPAPLPATDWLASNVLCLPIWSEMPEDTVMIVCRLVARAWEHASDLRRIASDVRA